MFSPPGVSLRECPVSYIRPESIEILRGFGKARQVHAAFGTSFFGPTLVDWPEWAVEAAAALELERVILENARMDAERHDE